jgi:hypothetical protein
MSKSAGNSSNMCSVCKERFVVDKLARCCEMKHDGVVFIRLPEQEPRTKEK